MHTVILGLVNSFSKNFNLNQGFDLPKQFEFFVNYLVVAPKTSDTSLQPIDITTADDDASLDGIAILIDGELVTSIEMARDMLEGSKRQLEVKIILTQVKSGETFDKKEITNFMSGVINFLEQESCYPEGEFNAINHEILFYILANVRNIKNNLPDIEVFFCTSGIYRESRELKGAFNLIKNKIQEKTYFHSIRVDPIDRKKIIELHDSLNKDFSARIKVEELFAIPATDKIPQSYLAMIKAKDYVNSLLIDQDNLNNSIRLNIFDENIRAYLGENIEVNNHIKSSLENETNKSIFSILNNGITIITPTIAYSPSEKTIELTNYQIINGCQTSNVLFDNKDLLTENVRIIVKFISTKDNDTINNIIASTNSQSHVDENAFLSLKDKAKLVQRYFITMEAGNNDENKIYFERRKNEFRNIVSLSSKIFDLRTIVQAYNAMFLNEPSNSSRYVKKIFEDKELFLEDDDESYYYVSAFCLYKVNVMINSKKFKYGLLKWHFLYLFKFIALNKTTGFERNSNKANKNSDELLKILKDKQKFEKIIEKFNRIVEKTTPPTIDIIKRQKYTSDLFNETKKILTKK